MSSFPATRIGGIEVTRMVIGTNPFIGVSHFTSARDMWLAGYFTDDRIYEVVRAAADKGLNGIVGPPADKIALARKRLEDETGIHLVYMVTPGDIDPDDIPRQIKWCADHKAEICLLHQAYTDNYLSGADRLIRGADELFAMIRDAGMVPGFATHNPYTLMVGGNHGAECYILPLNSTGFLSPLETDWVARIVQGCEKPVICIKPLGAGRIMPQTGIPFVYRNCKPSDTMAIGMLSPEEVDEDVQIALEALTGEEARIRFTTSRSKKIYEMPAQAG